MVIATQPKTPPSPHHKKRHGQHHRTSKHYVKTYWPYLPMLLVVVLGFAINSIWSNQGSVLGSATDLNNTSLLQATNIERTQAGNTALTLSSKLSKAAQEKADDMAARNYWAHTTPEGRQPWQFVSAHQYAYATAGENLAYGFDQSSDTVAGWMKSQSHRQNLLDTSYKDVGFGIARASNYQNKGPQTIIVALYASPQAATSGTATNAHDSGSVAGVRTAQADGTPRNVARIDILTNGRMQWAITISIVLIGIGTISLLHRHGKLWRRYLTRGEHFIISHPVLDIVIVCTAVAGFLMTQTIGVIH